MLGLGIGINKRRINSGYKELSLFGDNVVAFYPLNETSGIVAYDIKNGYNGRYTGTYVLNSSGTDGKKCVNFTNGSVLCDATGLGAAINPLEGFVSFWISLKNVSDWFQQVAMFSTVVDSSNRIVVRPGGTGTMLPFLSAGGQLNSSSSDTFGNTESVHIGFRWSKSNNKVTLFVNGLPAVSGVYNGIFSGIFPYATFFSGFSCYARQALILNIAPSDEQISQLVSKTGVIVIEGDSRSEKKGWSSLAMNRVADTKLRYNKYGKQIAAIAGSTVASMTARASSTNALKISGKNILVVWIGVNSYTLTAQQIYDGIKSYCQNARASGWNTIILCTEIDAQFNMDWHNTIYPALNALIYADHSFVDAVADLGARPELQDATNLTYYNADKIHLTTAGYAVVGEVVGDVLNLLL